MMLEGESAARASASARADSVSPFIGGSRASADHEAERCIPGALDFVDLGKSCSLEPHNRLLGVDRTVKRSSTAAARTSSPPAYNMPTTTTPRGRVNSLDRPIENRLGDKERRQLSRPRAPRETA
jgi:hypothetical protein